MQLIEGKTYPFKVSDSVELSNEKYFILTDSEGKKYMLPENQYIDYKIEEGQTIECKIDKINCSGKVFLEPEHPVFKQNEIYKFAFKAKTEIINSFGEKELHLTVADKFGKEWNVPVINDLPYDELVDFLFLKILSVKKGKPLLSFNYKGKIKSHKLKKGNRYKFTVLGISTLIENKEFLRLKDEFDNIHFVRYKFYSNYGFKTGSIVYCTMVNEEKYASYYLEPDYPGYFASEIYSFRFVKKDVYFHKDGRKEECLIAHDKDGNDCVVFYNQDDYKAVDLHTINAKVDYVYKGKLFVTLVSS